MWAAQFEKMSRINSVSIDDTDIFVCGDSISIKDEDTVYEPFASNLEIKS